LTLKAFGKKLVVFEMTETPEKDITGRRGPKPKEDKKDSLYIEKISSNIFYIHGTDVYEVESDGTLLLIPTPKFVRLYDLSKLEWRWRKY
jgi:hypothetical protein